MVKRFVPKQKMNGGARPGAGRPKGSLNAVARKRAHTLGTDPHELLCEWAQKGYILRGNRKEHLTADQLISCAKGAAPYYRAPMKAIAVHLEDQQPMRVELDMTKLASMQMSQLEMLRELLIMLSQGVSGGNAELAEVLDLQQGNAERFASKLRTIN